MRDEATPRNHTSDLPPCVSSREHHHNAANANEYYANHARWARRPYAAWQNNVTAREEPSRLMEIGRRLLGSGIPQNKKQHIAKYATGTRRMLNPSDPKRWGEVKAIARAMGEHAARAAEVELPEEERLLSLERCWAWCAIHHPLLIHYHRCLTACALMMAAGMLGVTITCT